MKRASFVLITLLTLAIVVPILLALGPQEESSAKTPEQVAYVKLIEGDVGYLRGDDDNKDNWNPAAINVPVQTGDSLYANAQSRAEVQLGQDGLVRLGNGAYVGVLQNTDDRFQLKLTSGTVTLRVQNPSREYEIDTPAMAFSTRDAGEYRIDVNEIGDSDITVREGRGVASVDQRGEETLEAPARYKVLSNAQPSLSSAPDRDSWDGWNGDRDNLAANSESRQYVPEGVYGYETLDRYGQWISTEYGMAWAPAGVAADWQPYRLGRWGWIDPYGWTWVSYEPWGWAPYHYGRWANVGGTGWVWVPGSQRQVFAPALVAYVPGTEWFGWFPLGPGEMYRPAVVREVVYYRNYRYATVINRTEIYSVRRYYTYRRDINRHMIERAHLSHQWGMGPRREVLYVYHADTHFRGRPPERFRGREVFAHHRDIPEVRKFSDKTHEYGRGGVAHPVVPVTVGTKHKPGEHIGVKPITPRPGAGGVGPGVTAGAKGEGPRINPIRPPGEKKVWTISGPRVTDNCGAQGVRARCVAPSTVDAMKSGTHSPPASGPGVKPGVIAPPVSTAGSGKKAWSVTQPKPTAPPHIGTTSAGNLSGGTTTGPKKWSVPPTQGGAPKRGLESYPPPRSLGQSTYHPPYTSTAPRQPTKPTTGGYQPPRTPSAQGGYGSQQQQPRTYPPPTKTQSQPQYQQPRQTPQPQQPRVQQPAPQIRQPQTVRQPPPQKQQQQEEDKKKKK